LSPYDSQEGGGDRGRDRDRERQGREEAPRIVSQFGGDSCIQFACPYCMLSHLLNGDTCKQTCKFTFKCTCTCQCGICKRACNWSADCTCTCDCRGKIVDGRVAKIAKERALLEQPFIRDNSKTVGEIIKESIAGIGENIQVCLSFPCRGVLISHPVCP
jgi:hypothetical protein